jgi:predicted ATPase
MAYLPVLDILRTYFAIKDGDREFKIKKKIQEKINDLDSGLSIYIPPLQEVLSLKVDDEEHLKRDSQTKRGLTFKALRDLFISESHKKSLVLTVEDLHWIDKTSEDFLDYLIGSIASARVLLILLYRPEYTHQWGSRSYYNRIGLDQLGFESSSELVKAMLEGGEVASELKNVIIDRVAGNPLFMEELIHTLLENGIIQKKDHQYILTRNLSEVQVPDTIQGIIAARMDRLEDHLKQTVQIASVIGRHFTFRILHAITGMREELRGHLLNLHSLEFIYEKSLYPELEYFFKHALTRDVAYSSLLQKRRKEIHEKIGLAIEDLYLERIEKFYKILAYHYTQSDRQEKAIEFAFLAGDQAAGLYANVEAATYYEQALTMARVLPDCPDAQRLMIEATLKLAAVGITRQDIERDRKNLEEATVMAEKLNDEPLLARVFYWLGRIQYVFLNIQTAIEYTQKSLQIADRLGDEILAAPPVNLMGRLYWTQSEFVKSSQMMVRSVKQMQQIGDKTEESTAAAFAGYVFAQLGEFERAFFYADHSLKLARQTNNPFTESAAYHFSGIDREQRGEWAKAINDYEEGRGIADKAGDLFRVHLIKFWEGRAYTLSGNPNQGHILLEESLNLGDKIGTEFGLSGLKTFLAECLLRRNDPDEAFSFCQEAIHLCEESGNKWLLAIALRTLSEIISCRELSDLEEARRAVQKAIDLQLEIEAKPELGRTYLSYAKLLNTTGENKKAKEYLTQANEIFRRMGMKWDLEQVEQVSKGF